MNKSLMLKLLASAAIVLVLSNFLFFSPQWENLLDKDLSQWEMYLSYRHKVGYKGEMPTDSTGKELLPIGYGKNVSEVFTVLEQDGVPVLKISGEIYGCIFTKQEYENYHLKLQVKWGQKKWVPRLDEDMDSGILYHSQGVCGVDYWRSWMLAQEFQIIENSMGDYWNIAQAQIDIKARGQQEHSFVFDKKAAFSPFGQDTQHGHFCKAGPHTEKPKGQWNTIELLCYQGKSIHIVNGEVVMALANSRFKDGGLTKPLTKGRIQIQSEAAEVYYKDIMIKEIDDLPKKYRGYFE